MSISVQIPACHNQNNMNNRPGMQVLADARVVWTMRKIYQSDTDSDTLGPAWLRVSSLDEMAPLSHEGDYGACDPILFFSRPEFTGDYC